MRSNIDRYFREQTVALGQIEQVPLQPAEYATGYDVVGYDAAGFMGDYFTQLGAIDLDIEHMLSHLVPSSVWIPLHEHAHIAAVRAEIETIMVEAMVTNDVQVSLDLGSVGYLFDPRVVTDSDADGYGPGAQPEEYVSYSATPMQYFEDLSTFTKDPLKKLASGDLSETDPEGRPTSLVGLDSFVVTTWPPPPDPQGRAVDSAAMAEALKNYARSGGNLILTDEGLKVLEAIGLAASGSVTRTLTNAGHVNVTNFEDPYAENLNSTASQTYYEVVLGYTVTNNAPHWSVPRAAWEAAGGTTVGTVDQPLLPVQRGTQMTFGRIGLGLGQVGIIGALLPPPTEKNAHYYGLADYGVTVTGGQILNNMLAFA
jgi:hypothetical protein